MDHSGPPRGTGMWWRFIAGVLFTCWVAATVAAGTVDAWLDRTQVTEGETVQLTLEGKGRLDGSPDTAPLMQDFDILGQSNGSRMTIVNGHTDASTTWTYELSPKHGGTLTIPALSVGSAQSAPLTLQVTAVPVAKAGSDANIVVESELSSNTPYVQGQVIYTVRLLHTVPLKSGQLTEPSSDHLLVQRLGEDREYATTRNGRRYQVIERRYALFPQASGRLELEAPVFDGEVPDTSRRRASPFSRFFGNDAFFSADPFNDLMTPTRKVRVRGDATVLEVQPRPAAAQGAQWLPAEQVELKGSWQPDGGEIHVGEPLTLTLDLQARGLTGGQLPGIAPEAVDGFDVYPDQAQRSSDAQASGVTGRLQQKIAYIPRHAGALTVPAIDLSWWDTGTDKERHASLPQHIIQVLPATGQNTTQAPGAVSPAVPTPAPAQAAAAPAPARTSAIPAAAATPLTTTVPAPGYTRWWPWISAVLAAGWLLTLVSWWWRSRRKRDLLQTTRGVPADTGSAARARRQFLDACKAGDAFTARRTLLEWTRAHWPHDPPRGLQSLAQRLNDPATQQELAALDRAIYTPAGRWDGAALASRVQQLPQAQTGNGGERDVLAPLYPESRQG
jgi:BatD DUF11 like domain